MSPRPRGSPCTRLAGSRTPHNFNLLDFYACTTFAVTNPGSCRHRNSVAPVQSGLLWEISLYPVLDRRGGPINPELRAFDKHCADRFRIEGRRADAALEAGSVGLASLDNSAVASADQWVTIASGVTVRTRALEHIGLAAWCAGILACIGLTVWLGIADVGNAVASVGWGMPFVVLTRVATISVAGAVGGFSFLGVNGSSFRRPCFSDSFEKRSIRSFR